MKQSLSLTNDVSVPLTVLLVVVLVNAVNFIDGLDGLAAGVVGIAALSQVSPSAMSWPRRTTSCAPSRPR